jgi:peptide/nickel transport system ATP-binding protein
MERCTREMPVLKEIDGHKVRCFLYEEDGKGEGGAK